MNRLSAYFPLIIVVFLAGTTFWLERIVSNEARNGLGNKRHDPDQIVNQVSIDRFDNTGRRISRITASQLQHYPDDDTAELANPVITLTRDERPTVFSSKTAHADNASKVVVMRDTVRGNRAAGVDSAMQTLETEELTVLTDDEIARTDKPVRMTQGASTLSGIGAEWNNLSGIFTIHHEVRAVIMPKAPQP
ncbi:hypothetical protein GCM10027046_15950 [Uliginosibacterium flavum]|uniref:LPS export ABC transporter periplasmic protein LptC n=1 Tax=Uliginosibacterium flavum TaxID=1396831 RepID=A0ABV2TR41_9RHOO